MALFPSPYLTIVCFEKIFLVNLCLLFYRNFLKCSNCLSNQDISEMIILISENQAPKVQILYQISGKRKEEKTKYQFYSQVKFVQVNDN